MIEWLSFPTFGMSPTNFYYVKIRVREGKTNIEKHEEGVMKTWMDEVEEVERNRYF